MRFLSTTTFLMALGFTNAIRLQMDPDPPVEPDEPVTRRVVVSRMTTGTVTFDDVIADLNKTIEDVKDLEKQMDDLQVKYDECKDDLAVCQNGGDPGGPDEPSDQACTGVENLADLKAAISGASSGTTATIIEICPNTIKVSSAIKIDNKNVVLKCFETGNCTFDGELKTIVFDIDDATVVFDGINVVKGSNKFGGGMHIKESTVTFNKASLSGNKAQTFGGGLDLWHSDVTIDESTFEDNVATEQGGAILAMYSELKISDSTFTKNDAKYGGAIAAWYGDDVEIAGSSFSENTAQKGGALSVYDTDLFVSGDTTFIDNVADSGGAALRVSKSPDKGSSAKGSQVELKDVLFANNSLDPGQKGADIYIKDDKSNVVCGTGTDDVTFCDDLGDDKIYDGGNDSTNCDKDGETIDVKCP